MILEAITDLGLRSLVGSTMQGRFFGEMPVEFPGPGPGPVCRVVGLLRKQTTNYVTRQTSHANNFVNAKSHAREKRLLAGYQIGGCAMS